MSFFLSKKFINVSFSKKRLTIAVVFEDEWLLVVNKPTKMLTISSPRRKKEIPTLTEVLNEDFKHKNLPHRFHPVHRLDRETSGLIIYAKGKAMRNKMMRLFKDREVKKTYVAFVHGKIPTEKGKISFPIEGLEALTEFRVIETRGDFTVVEAAPRTGRTNQLRIHFKLLGHPLVGEKKFSFRRDFRLRSNRLCLHAKSLEFVHPVTGKLVALDTDLPRGMQNFLEKG